MNHSDSNCLSDDTINNYYQLINITKDQLTKYQEFSMTHTKTISDYRKISLPEKGLPLSPIKKKTQEMLKQYSQSLELFSKSIESSLKLQSLKYNTLFIKYSKLLSTLQNNQGCILSELRVNPSSTSSTSTNTISIYDEGSVSAKDHRESLKPYHFDYCFSPSHSQLSIFQFNEPVLTSVVDGYRICMLLYGSSDTNKSYTLNGNNENGSNFGIIQMTVEYLMNYKKTCKDKSFEIYLSIYEMVNDEVYDLQSPKHTKITISETSSNIQLTGNESKSLEHYTDFVTIYKTALASSTSKDSHKIILITIKRVTDIGIKVTGKLCFADLGDSDSKNKYNQSSLQSLKDVLRALKNKEKFVPHRSNKITLLLKEFLNHDSKLIMLFHILSTTTNETISTLNYASLATPMELSIPKKYIEIEANSVTNRKLSDEISSLKSEIKRLNEELKKSKSELQAKEIDISNADATIKSLKYQLEMKNSVFTDTKTDKENIDKKMFELKKTNDKLNEEIKQLEQKVNSMKYKETLYKQKIDVLTNSKSGNSKNSPGSSSSLSGDNKYLSESKALKELQMKYDKLERKYTKVELQLVQLTDSADLKTPDVTPRPTPKSSMKKTLKQSKSSLANVVTYPPPDEPYSTPQKQKNSNSIKTSPQVSSASKKKLNNNDSSSSGNKKVFDFTKKTSKISQRSTSLNFSNFNAEPKNGKTKTKQKSKLKNEVMGRSLSDDNMVIFPPAPPAEVVENNDNNNKNESENNNDNENDNNDNKKDEQEDNKEFPPQLLFNKEEENEGDSNSKPKEKEKEKKEKSKRKNKLSLKTPPTTTRSLNTRRKPSSGDSSPVSDSATPDTSPFPFLRKSVTNNNNNDIVNLLQHPNINNKKSSKSVYDNIFSLSPDSVSEEDDDKRLTMYVSPITSPDYSDLEDNDPDTCNSANSNNSNNNNNNNNNNSSGLNITVQDKGSDSKKDTPTSTKSSSSRPPRYNGSNSSNRSGTNSPLNGSDAFFNGLESPISLSKSLYTKLHKMEIDKDNNNNNNNSNNDIGTTSTGRKMSGEEAFFDGLVTLTPREKKEKKNATKIQSWYRGLVQRRKYMDMLFDLKHGGDF